MNEKVSAIALIGPTAIGKTNLSLAIAEHFSAEIISLDSMQVYRYMDIGTAKATVAERARVPHHLIDIVNPDENYHAGRYVDDCSAACKVIEGHGKIPLLVGGTGLYLKALQDGLFEAEQIPGQIRDDLTQKRKEKGNAALFKELKEIDPPTAMRIHPNDAYRIQRALEIFHATGIPWSQHLEKQKHAPLLQNVLKIGLTCDREVLYQRINQRVEEMIGQGLVDEVRMLLEMGYHGELKSMQSIGYRHMVNFIEGNWNWEDCVALLARDTRHYAKRQLTWFRADQGITWLHPSQQREIIALIDKTLHKTT